jgi:hypothetical protein
MSTLMRNGYPLPPNYNYTDPKYTSHLLERLDNKYPGAFTFAVFQKVNHTNNRKSSIQEWIDYHRNPKKVEKFLDDPGGNPYLQRRLEIIFEAAAAFENPSEKIFKLLAEAAAIEKPVVKHPRYEPA